MNIQDKAESMDTTRKRGGVSSASSSLEPWVGCFMYSSLSWGGLQRYEARPSSSESSWVSGEAAKMMLGVVLEQKPRRFS